MQHNKIIINIRQVNNNDFEKTGFSISPNPTAGILNITVVGKVDYRLLNVRGQVLKTGILDAGESKINLLSLVSGVYFLNIKTSKGALLSKVVRK